MSKEMSCFSHTHTHARAHTHTHAYTQTSVRRTGSHQRPYSLTHPEAVRGEGGVQVVGDIKRVLFLGAGGCAGGGGGGGESL